MAVDRAIGMAVGQRRLVVSRRDGQGVQLWLDGRRIGRVSVYGCAKGRARMAVEFGPEVTVARDELQGRGGAEDVKA